MADIQSKEQLRRVYQRVDESTKTFIPAKPKADLYGEGHIYRVCAYCRVSTDNDEQLSSFELQQAHYRQLVEAHEFKRFDCLFAKFLLFFTCTRKSECLFNKS